MQLRYHGPFPPLVGEGTPGAIPAKQDPTKSQSEEEYEPCCLLQAWAEPREGGKLSYVFIMYSLQAPPWEIAKQVVRYFRLDPMHDAHTFIECIPPNQELSRPVFTKFNFKWEWQQQKFVRRGANWVWQSSGYGVVLPYSEAPITADEEAIFIEQLSALLLESEQQEHKAALPQPRPHLLLPTFSRGGNNGSALFLEEKAGSLPQRSSSVQ